MTIAELNEEEIMKLEDFAKRVPAVIRDYCMQNNICLNEQQTAVVTRLFCGLYDDPKNFKIRHGEKMLLGRVALWVKEQMNSGETFSICTEKRSTTTQTLMGNFFATEGTFIYIFTLFKSLSAVFLYSKSVNDFVREEDL